MEPPDSLNHHKNFLDRPKMFFGEASLPQIVVQDRRWHCFVPSLNKFIRRILWICREDTCLPHTLILSTDRVVRILNGRYRGRYKPTNVLTFSPHPHFSDIFLAFETVYKEAHKAHRPVAHHLAHLLIHGCLHLAGYDHHHPRDAQRMEMLESFLLSRLHISNPWKPRS